MTEASLKKPTFAIIFVLLGSLFMAIFNYTLSILASIYIVSELGGSSDTVTYSTSFYALGNAIGIPLGAYFLGKWGTRWPLIICSFLFACFAWIDCVTLSYLNFLISRFLLGVASGPYYALIFSMLNVLIPLPYKAAAPSIFAAIFIATPVLGATWGGWIAYEWNWRIVYYIDVPIAFVFVLLQYIYIKDYDTRFMRKIKFDLMGFLSFASAIVSLGFIITVGQELDWFRSNLISSLFVFGMFSLIFFVLWEINHEDPIVNLSLLKEPALVFALLHLAILFGIYFGNIILLSLWLKFWASYTAYWINLLLAITSVTVFVLLIFRAQFAFGDCRIFWSLAVIFLGISSYYTTYFNIYIDFERVAISRIFAGFGLAFFLPPIFRMAYGLFPTKYVDVLVLLQVTRALGSGLGAAIFSTVSQRRQVFFYERLVSRLTPLSPRTDEYYADASLFGLHGQTATAQLDYFAERVSSSLALDDSFYLMTWLLVGMLLTFALTFLWPKKVFNP